jgi:hypothetical protein
MPIVDGEYKFIYVDVGQQSRTSDGFFFCKDTVLQEIITEWPSNPK